nr:MAG TPA: hypothetical protein [Bacteriophage sp.]
MMNFLLGFAQLLAFIPVFLVIIVCTIFYVLIAFILNLPVIVFCLVNDLIAKIRS